jgi:hypothetical protein
MRIGFCTNGICEVMETHCVGRGLAILTLVHVKGCHRHHISPNLILPNLMPPRGVKSNPAEGRVFSLKGL